MGLGYCCGPTLPRDIDEEHTAEQVRELYDAWLDGWTKELREQAASDDPAVLWDTAYQIFGPGSQELMIVSALTKLAARAS